MPPLALASLPPDLAALRDKLDAAAQSTDDSARQAVRGLAARHARALDLDAARAPWPQLEAALRRYLAEVEAAPMPVGGMCWASLPMPTFPRAWSTPCSPATWRNRRRSKPCGR